MPTKASEYGHTILMTPKEYEALEKDATRYRWLRGTQDEIVVGTSPGVMDHGLSATAATYEEWLSGATMDAAIDAAMGKD